ncbi:MAG: DNA primase [Desulfamplus sp.]|nr:DNA primase [Desulfamplus sp.]
MQNNNIENEDPLIDFIDKEMNKVTSEVVIEALDNEEDGDAELFKLIFRNKFVFSTSTGSWLQWEGSHWEANSTINHIVRAGRSAVIGLYKREIFAINKRIKTSAKDAQPDRVKIINQKQPTPDEELRNELIKRVKALQKGVRYKSVIERASDSANGLFIDGSNLDNNPYLLPCANGTINLLTGDFRESRQEDWNTKISPIEWKGLLKQAKLWEKTLLEIFNNDQDVVDCFQRVIGFSIIGEVREAKAIILSGKGRNGKTLIMETIKKILGDLAKPIPAEMLLTQYARNPSAPSPDVMQLKGLRIAIASETQENRHLDEARIKWFTGSDSLTGRNPHDTHSVIFQPSHTLFLLTNNKPRVNPDDFAIWERLLVFPFELSFVDREPTKPDERRANKTLKDDLLQESSGILAWLVRGCLEWQKQGINPPVKLKQEVDLYQREQDYLAEFIDDCCNVGDDSYTVAGSVIYKKFEEWWIENKSNNVPQIQTFGKKLGKRFNKKQTNKANEYQGITLKN